MTLARQTMLATVGTATAVVVVAGLLVQHALRETLDVFSPHFAMMRRMMGFGPDLHQLYALVDRAVVQSLGLAIALALLVSLWIGARMARSVKAIDVGLARFAAGRFDEPIAAGGSAEVARIADGANAMAAQLQRMRHAERELVAGVIHDLAHPVTAMRGTLEHLRDGFVVASDPRVQARLLDAVTSLEETIGDLRDVAAADVGSLRLAEIECDLVPIVERLAAVYRDAAERRGVALAVQTADAQPVRSDPGRLERLLGNLVINAIQATPPGGAVALSATRSGDRDVLCVEDEAGAEAAIHLRALLHDRRRLGLGLRVVTAIADALHADVSVCPNGHGSTVAVTLLPARPAFSTTHDERTASPIP